MNPNLNLNMRTIDKVRTEWLEPGIRPRLSRRVSGEGSFSESALALHQPEVQ